MKMIWNPRGKSFISISNILSPTWWVLQLSPCSRKFPRSRALSLTRNRSRPSETQTLKSLKCSPELEPSDLQSFRNETSQRLRSIKSCVNHGKRRKNFYIKSKFALVKLVFPRRAMVERKGGGKRRRALLAAPRKILAGDISLVQLFLKQTLFSSSRCYPSLSALRWGREFFYLQTLFASSWLFFFFFSSVCGGINTRARTYNQGFEWNPKTFRLQKTFFCSLLLVGVLSNGSGVGGERIFH